MARWLNLLACADLSIANEGTILRRELRDEKQAA